MNLKSVSFSPMRIAVVCGCLSLVGLAVGRIHLRVQTTLIGYDIGRLKGDESRLLEERSLLKMQLAKLTTKKHLMLMTGEDGEQPAQRTVALK